MTHFLITATDQEIFDAAYTGMASQGFERSSDKKGCCVYADKKGRHCTVGWPCVLKQSKIPVEGSAINSEIFWKSIGENIEQVPESRIDFLIGLSYIHYNNRSPDRMKLALEKNALGNNLTVPNITLELI